LVRLNGVQYDPNVRAWKIVQRTWLTSLRVGPAILLLAFLPSVCYLGHWEDFARNAVGLEEPQELELDARTLADLDPRPAKRHTHRRPHRAATAQVPTRDTNEPAEPAGQGEHQAHCHASVSSCSEQPVPTDLRMLRSIIDLKAPTLIESQQPESTLIRVGFVTSIPTEPPRSL
jgi:hypothetical protein